MRTTIAIYPGTCGHCGEFHIRPGIAIQSRADGRWEVLGCTRPDIRNKKKQDSRQGRDVSDVESNYNRPSHIDERILAELAYLKAHPIDNSAWAGEEVFC